MGDEVVSGRVIRLLRCYLGNEVGDVIPVLRENRDWLWWKDRYGHVGCISKQLEGVGWEEVGDDQTN